MIVGDRVYIVDFSAIWPAHVVATDADCVAVKLDSGVTRVCLQSEVETTEREAYSRLRAEFLDAVDHTASDESLSDRYSKLAQMCETLAKAKSE